MRKKYKILLVIISIGFFLVSKGISLIVTCGSIKLITLCFGWEFRWSIAIGIWLIIGLLHNILVGN